MGIIMNTNYFTRKVIFLISIILLTYVAVNADDWQRIHAYKFIRANPIIKDHENRLLVGTPEGLYKSSDMGENWILVKNGNYVGKKIIAVQNDLYMIYNNSLVLSQDGGQTWQNITGTLDNFWSLDLCADSNGTIYLGVSQNYKYKIFFTTDKGENWNRIEGWPSDSYFSHMTVNETGYLYVGAIADARGDLFLSRDTGKTWIRIDNDHILDFYRTSTLFTLDSNIVLWGRFEEYGLGILYPSAALLSRNNGATWTELPFKGARQFYIDSTGNLYAASDDGLFISPDSGETWTKIKDNAVSTITTINDSLIFAGSSSNNGNLWKSTDNGSSWEPLTIESYPEPSIRDFYLTSSDEVIYTTEGGVFITPDDGQSSTKIGNIPHSLHLTKKNVLFGVFQDTPYDVFYLYRSVDFGKTWEAVLYLDEYPQLGVVSNKIGGVLAIKENSFFYSTQDGQESSWRKGGLVNDDIRTAALNDAGDIILGGSYEIYLSTDGGSHFKTLAHPNPYHIPPNDIEFLSRDTIIVVLRDGSLFRSSNKGKSWDELDTGGLFLKRFFPAKHHFLFATGLHSEIYYSRDYGENWRTFPLDDGMGKASKVAAPLNGKLYVLSSGNLYLRQETIVHTDDISPIVPYQNEIMYNYPNPFNGQTTIKFSVASAATVTIRIFNVSGETVIDLKQTTPGAGEYLLSWDGRNKLGKLVSSGIYFFTMFIDGKMIDSGKMVLMK